VRGINVNKSHALWTDSNNVAYPTQFLGINPGWNQSNPLDDWIGRIDYVASGKAVAPTALIVLQQAVQAWQDTSNADAIDPQLTAANNASEDGQADGHDHGHGHGASSDLERRSLQVELEQVPSQQ